MPLSPTMSTLQSLLSTPLTDSQSFCITGVAPIKCSKRLRPVMSLLSRVFSERMSPNSRAFSMAIAAWLANDSTNVRSLSVNSCAALRVSR